MSVWSAGALFLVTLVAAMVACPLAARIGVRAGLVDQPRHGELQVRPIARTGGYGLVVAFLIGIAFSTLVVERNQEEWFRLLGLLVGASPLLVMAVVDDLRRLAPGPQAIGQIAAATIAMGFGLVIDNIANPWGGITTLPWWIAIPFTLLWVVGMINTVNFLDTMDGIAGGVGAIAALILFARSVDLGQTSVASLPLILAAAGVGFLVFNFHPARLFMGSSGSLFLGYALAILAIFGGAKIATAAMVMGLPILDVALVILFRRARGRSPFAGGDSAHLTHRLHAIGWSQRRIALSLYGLCLTAGLLAMTMSRLQKVYLFIAVFILFAIVAAVVISQVRRLEQAERARPA